MTRSNRTVQLWYTDQGIALHLCAGSASRPASVASFLFYGPMTEAVVNTINAYLADGTIPAPYLAR